MRIFDAGGFIYSKSHIKCSKDEQRNARGVSKFSHDICQEVG